MEYSNSFSVADLRKGLELTRAMGVKVKEQPVDTDQEASSKAQSLKELMRFMQAIDEQNHSDAQLQG